MIILHLIKKKNLSILQKYVIFLLYICVNLWQSFPQLFYSVYLCFSV